MKAFTDLEQSEKLSEILPLESADMWYHGHGSPWESEREYDSDACPFHSMRPNWDIPCWSLSALLEVLPEGIIENYYVPNLQKEEGKYSIAYGNEKLLCTADNPVDACVEMIIKLHDQKLL